MDPHGPNTLRTGSTRVAGLDGLRAVCVALPAAAAQRVVREAVLPLLSSEACAPGREGSRIPFGGRWRAKDPVPPGAAGSLAD